MLEITDQDWRFIKKYLKIEYQGKLGPKGGHKGRKRLDDRMCFNRLLWMLKSNVPWRLYPFSYPSKATVHRRLQEWSKSGALEKAFKALVNRANELGKLSKDTTFIDGSLVPAKKKARQPALIIEVLQLE
jgi:transposase